MELLDGGGAGRKGVSVGVDTGGKRGVSRRVEGVGLGGWAYLKV